MEIIAVHTPESADERVEANVIARVRELGIPYPVLLDPDGVNWNRWKQQYWPALYLVDKQGRLRCRWVGELESGGAGGEAKVAQRIEQLLNEPAPGPGGPAK